MLKGIFLAVVMWIWIGFFILFFAFICWLFMKDVFKTFAAAIKKEKFTTMLTPWQMFYHIVIGLTSGIFSVTFLLGIISIFFEDYYKE